MPARRPETPRIDRSAAVPPLARGTAALAVLLALAGGPPRDAEAFPFGGVPVEEGGDAEGDSPGNPGWGAGEDPGWEGDLEEGAPGEEWPGEEWPEEEWPGEEWPEEHWPEEEWPEGEPGPGWEGPLGEPDPDSPPEEPELPDGFESVAWEAPRVPGVRAARGIRGL